MHANIICEYCIAFKVWLKYKNTIHEILFAKYANAIDLRKIHPRNNPLCSIHELLTFDGNGSHGKIYTYVYSIHVAFTC